MFTGIIEEFGTVYKVKLCNEGKITIRAKKIVKGLQVGESVAVNGVCLTITELTKDYFTADVSGETLRRSNLGSLKKGNCVNLERAVALGGRLGGHIVSGHVDGTGRIIGRKPEGNSIWLRVTCESRIIKYIAEKGSVAVDGISLTVAAVNSSSFNIVVIPFTQTKTTLMDKRIGEVVNIEVDVLAKYLEKLFTY